MSEEVFTGLLDFFGNIDVGKEVFAVGAVAFRGVR